VPSRGEALLRLFLANKRASEELPGSIAPRRRGRRAHFIEAKRFLWEAHHGSGTACWELEGEALVGKLQIKHLDWEVGRARLAYSSTEPPRARVDAGSIPERSEPDSGLGLNRVMLRTIVATAGAPALAEGSDSARKAPTRDFRTAKASSVDLTIMLARLGSEPLR